MKFRVVNVYEDQYKAVPHICISKEEIEALRHKYWPEHTVVDSAVEVPEIRLQTNSGVLVIRDGDVDGSVDVSFIGKKGEQYIGSVGRIIADKECTNA